MSTRPYHLLQCWSLPVSEKAIVSAVLHPSPSRTTIPPSRLSTSQRPDIVLIFYTTKLYYWNWPSPLYLTTCLPADKNLIGMPLISNLKSAGYFPKLLLLEVGFCGFISLENFETPSQVLPQISETNPRRLRNDLSHISTLCSFSIFSTCTEPSWSSPFLLSTSLSSHFSTFLLRSVYNCLILSISFSLPLSLSLTV